MSAFRPLAALALLAAALPAHAQPTPRTLKDLAGEVHGFLKMKGEESINMGTVSGPDNHKTGGPGLAQKIKVELEKLGVGVKGTGANHTFKAEFAPDEAEPKPGQKPLTALRIDVKLTDKKGKAATTFEIFVTDEQQIIESLGLTVEIPPTPTPGPNHTRDKALREVVENAVKPALDGGEVESPKGTFGLEVLVGGKVRPAKEKDGEAFVELKAGETYVVRLHNQDEDIDMAVDLTIDGISVFEFSEIRADKTDPKSPPRFKTYIVPKGKSIDVPGWHKDLKEVFAFEVSGYADSAAALVAKKADSSDIGQITAVFRAAWPKGTQPPKGEGNGKDAEGNATKLGPPTKFATEPVEMEFGNVRGSVCVRYSKPAK